MSWNWSLKDTGVKTEWRNSRDRGHPDSRPCLGQAFCHQSDKSQGTCGPHSHGAASCSGQLVDIGLALFFYAQAPSELNTRPMATEPLTHPPGATYT